MSRLYFCNANGQVSLHLDGTIRAVRNPAVYGRLFAGPINPAAMTRYHSVPSIAEGPPLSENARLVKSSDAPEVYLVDDQSGVQVRRHVASAQMFDELGFDWNKVEVWTPSEVNRLPAGQPCSFSRPEPPMRSLRFYCYNPIYQAQDGKLYTITINDSAGKQVYSHSGTTNAGLDTYYGATWGVEEVNLAIGQTYVIHVTVTSGADVYEWSHAGFAVNAQMDPNIKILHSAYSQTGFSRTVTFYSYNPVYQAQDGKPYTITITDSTGKQVYSHSETTNAGLDTYYGTTWGRDAVNLTIGKNYSVRIVVTNGFELYEWEQAGFCVNAQMDPNIKILHTAYSRKR
jgi:Zn-finger protein